MGIRGELFSTKVILQNRTYFFNVKENRLGDLYLNIVESKNREEGGFERQSVILFAEDLQDFLQGFDDALRVLEKAEREKRRDTSGRMSNSRMSVGREPRSKEPGSREPRDREERSREPRDREERSREPRDREQKYKGQRNREPRGRDFKKPGNDRKPVPRQYAGRKSREGTYESKPRRDSYAGKPRRSEDSNRDHSRKRVVVKKTTRRD
jgi:hypothetical protein